MANLAASATQFVGQTLVRTASAIAINQATSYISRAFDTRNFEGPRLDSFHLQTSRDGAPMARVFGRVRLAGQVIWASHVRESSSESPVGGKGGGPTQTEYSYSLSFAIGLCEGEIAGVDRIWANGAPLETRGLDMRVYRGAEDEVPDPIIVATEGGAVPAFRGTAYVVFEDFPLGDYGNRLPQFNFEVLRPGKRVGRLENLIQSVNLLPGSGEFAYATDIIEEGKRPGETQPLNMNNISGKADIELALDQLQAQLPNCRNVSLISSWFATSTNIENCQIRPGIERRKRNIRNAVWQVGRATRKNAYVISEDEEGRPNYGGTPSDDSLIQAIQSIKSRGMSVTLYPFILVDMEGFPWRGRITGEAVDVASFFGGADPSDYSLGGGEDDYRAVGNGFRNFILSHANLALRAGGVDRFVLGSEMVGLTTIRDAENMFPATTELARLAGDVRAMLGAETGLTYAADWSEYFGFHPQDGSGDVFFHLDDLWSHPAISAVGIDAYFPLSDWRAGAHIDSQAYSSIYDPNYLNQNVEGGEGFDWYYASETDRETQNRSPILEWIYRYKDVRNWWLNEHCSRINGVVQTPSNWVPQSKPFWFTEIGCPAVSFGSNQPNVFIDAKSDESKFPYKSDNYRDDLIQRRYLEAMIDYWAEPNNNPVSDLTGLPMVDTSATSIWAWDARPFPDFPARRDIWADGPNWQTGHWINGRVGMIDLKDVIEDICADAGLHELDISGVTGLVSGFLIDRPMRARDALSVLIDSYDLIVTEHAGQLRFSSMSALSVSEISADRLIAQMDRPIQYTLVDNMSSLRDARLSYIDAGRDYQVSTMSARNELAETVRIADLQAPIVMDISQARNIVERRLAQSEPARRMASLALPVAEAPKVGDLVKLPAAEGVWQVEQLRLGIDAKLTLSAVPDHKANLIIAGVEPAVLSDPIWVSEPVALAFDLPGLAGAQVGALLKPFHASELSFAGVNVRALSPIKIGATLSPLFWRTPALWDRVSEVDIYMPNGVWFAVSEGETLAGANRFAIETQSGWEIIGAADITLIGENTYRLKTLLRGLSNSDDHMMSGVTAGARILALDAGLVNLPIDQDFIGQSVEISVKAGGRHGVSADLNYAAADLTPLSLAHITSKAIGAETEISWIPRNLTDAEAVEPSLEVEITWAGGTKTVAGRTAIIPISHGSGAEVTLTPINSEARRGASARIAI